jgi:hypothetical protein
VPIDVTIQGSPGWWLKRLSAQLVDRRPRLDRLARYYAGDPDLPEGAEGCRPAYRDFQAKSRTNYPRLIVKAPRDRMVLTGFRTGADDDENGDRAARAILSANGLRVGAGDLHSWFLSMGDAYAIVGPPTPDTADLPLITVEDPREVVTAHDPRNPRKAVAALKMFTDDIAGRDLAYLYLPGRVFIAFKQTDQATAGTYPDFIMGGWEWGPGGAEGSKLPFDVVPVVRFRNEDGMGEFEPHMDLIDRINSTILDRMVIAKVQAYRQRAIKGVPDVDADGNEIDYSGVFAPGAGSMWLLPEGAELWEGGQADLMGILAAVKDDVRDLAAVTSTPLYFITPDAANGSAEGASTMREGLVFKTEDRINRASEGWSQVMSLAFRFAGDTTRATLLDLEPLWQPAERFSLSERADAASKLATSVPWRTLMTDVMQFPPDQVNRMETERAGDALIADLNAPPVAPVTDGTVTA